MTMLAAFAAAALAPLCAAAPPPGDVQLEGTVTYEVGTGRALVRDGAVLRRGAVVVRARSVTYDPATGEVRATGGVLLTDATHVVAADAVRAVLQGELEAEDVVAFVKGEPVDLSRVTTLAEARRLGRNRLSFSGARLAGELEGRFRLYGARLTLCDCEEGRRPSWEVSARDADVVPGRRAVLRWAVLRIAPAGRSIPVLALPWLYLPLGERQSGLLMPEIRSTGASGVTIAQPLFITLGRSADATLAAEYAFGSTSAPSARQGRVRGPGARLELRWALAEAAEGRAELAWVHDLEREAYGAGGDRLALDAAHAQHLSARTSLRAALQLTSDTLWMRDMAAGGLKWLPYRRSDVLVSRRGEDVLLEGGASYFQPLLPFGAVEGERAGVLGADLRTASRWPSAAATILPVFAGPLQLSARAGVSRFAPVAVSRDLLGRPAADRADARLEIASPLLLGQALSVTPYVRGGAATYAFEAAQDPSSNAWGVAGAALSTELSRRFGAVRHAIAPRFEWRAGTAAAGGALPWPAYDLLDRSAAGLLSAAPGAFSQARAAIETRLEIRGVEVAKIEAGQDLDLRSGRFAETFGAAAMAAGPFRADASVRALALDERATPAVPAPVPSPLDRFTELRASAGIADRRGDAVSAGFFSIGSGGSGLLVAGLDPLFDLRPGGVEPSAGASGAVRIVAGSATLGYDMQVRGPNQMTPLCSGGALRRAQTWEVAQHMASVRWASRCRCFRIVANLGVNDCGNFSYHASIDLSALAGATRVR